MSCLLSAYTIGFHIEWNNEQEILSAVYKAVTFSFKNHHTWVYVWYYVHKRTSIGCFRDCRCVSTSTNANSPACEPVATVVVDLPLQTLTSIVENFKLIYKLPLQDAYNSTWGIMLRIHISSRGQTTTRQCSENIFAIALMSEQTLVFPHSMPIA